jgi:hypothetical protein
MIKIVTLGAPESLSIRTEGLRSRRLPEIEVSVAAPDLTEAARAFLFHVSEYLLTGDKTLRPGETLSYGYWLTKFERAGGDLLEVWEYNCEATKFVKGATLALTYWRDQHAVCTKYDAAFQPPRPDLLTVVSDGVLEGWPVQGVRYPSPDGTSGWWITTDLYNGEVSALKHEHTYHVTAVRPDLAKFLALPVGFRYDLSTHEDVWFDQTVLASE